MLEVESVYNTAFNTWPFSEDYNWLEGSYKPADDDRAIATIREYLSGNIVDVRLSAQNANAAISMVQVFVDAAATIRENLILMEELAEKAANRYYSDTDKASMQKQIEALAKNINHIVDNTEYDNNKLFTANGQVISRSIGNGYTINLFARDLSFNIEIIDLTKDAKTALATVRNAQKQANECTEYLSRQNKRLQNAMATIEHKMASAVGIDSSSFQTKIMEQLIANISAAISNDTDTFTQIQSSITPDETLQLLKDGN